MLSPGQRLFEYEIVRLLGRGGFAAVYEARDRMLDRRVAIKQLLLEKARDQKAIKRFMQEARIAAALEHPNIVTVYALRIEDRRIYMIMEYLSGGSVKDLLARQGKLSVEQTASLATGVCEGLARLHAKGIIHRDIKAENILLTEDGRPKIIDLGIAHVPEEAGGLALTQVGFQPSTVLYSSPEQFRGEKLDARSDVYQVGELLYHMLTGHHYIDVKTIEAQADALGHNIRRDLKLYMVLEKAICKDTPAGLDALWKEAGGITAIVEVALAKKKEDRFNNTEEFAAALKAITAQMTPVPVQVNKIAAEH